MAEAIKGASGELPGRVRRADERSVNHLLRGESDARLLEGEGEQVGSGDQAGYRALADIREPIQGFVGGSGVDSDGPGDGRR